MIKNVGWLDDINDENDRSPESDDASAAGDGKILPSPVFTASTVSYINNLHHSSYTHFL